jgi:hypothetical protein
MYSKTGDLIAWGMDDPDVFNPLRGLTENGDTWLQNDLDIFSPSTGYLKTVDTWMLNDPPFPGPMKGILIATPISLTMWAVIILALPKLFRVLITLMSGLNINSLL